MALVAVAGAVTYLLLLDQGWGPLARKTVLWSMMVGLAAGSLGRPLRHGLGLVRDWAPLIVALGAYDIVRKSADEVNSHVAVGSLVNWEKTLSFGLTPARFLFELVGRDRPLLVALPMDIVWMSHFFVPLLLAGWLWVRHREVYHFYASLTCALFVLAVSMYLLMPSAPPWFAAANGYGHELADLVRTSGSGLESLGVEFVTTNMQRGVNSANPFAALPSLHAGCSIVVAATLSRKVPGFRWKRVIWLYPAAMAFTVVSTGEHYLIDVWASIPFIWLAWRAAEWLGPRWGAVGARYIDGVTRAGSAPAVARPDSTAG